MTATLPYYNRFTRQRRVHVRRARLARPAARHTPSRSAGRPARRLEVLTRARAGLTARESADIAEEVNADLIAGALSA